MKAQTDHSTKAFMLELYHTYYGLVYKKILSITQETDSIEDLVNDTFVKLIEKAPLLRTFEQRKAAAYITYTARSVAVNFAKRRSIHNRHLFYTDEMELAVELASVEDQVLKQQELECLRDAVFRLPEKQRDLLYFKYMLELSDAEIAKLLNISTPSVRQYLTRARRATRALMSEGGDTNGE